MLDETQLEVIAEHPLVDDLDYARSKLRDGPQEEAVASLLGALFASSAAFDLQASDGGGNIASKLFTVQQSVRGGKLELSAIEPLVETVITTSADTEIWDAVLNLLQSVNPSTPPLSNRTPTFSGTPIKASSSSLDDSETRDTVERELFFEIKDCIHRDVPGFFERHFDSSRWNAKQQQMLEKALGHHDGTRWKAFPTDPWEQPVWQWLTALEEDALSGATYTLHTNKTATEFKERKGQVDILFRKKKTKGGGRSNPNDVLVVGEHKRSLTTSDFKSCLLQLSRHVRGVFADQPMRRFVHAFTIKGTIMELWVFDRSGPYSSGEFDIHREPKKLAQALVAYATMEDNAMGLDTAIERKNGHRYVTVEDSKGNDMQVELNTLLVRQRAIVCRGTTCFSTRKGVAKFSWRSDKRPSEVKHLKLAQSKGVEGVAALVAHREITSIGDLRKDLEFSNNTRHNFRRTTQERSNSNSSFSREEEKSSSSKKRKSEEDHRKVHPSTKRQRSTSQRSSLLAQLVRTKNSRPKPSLYTQDGSDFYENRILSCLVISPAGRVLSDFRSVRELLEALRDAIKAHQSLYLKGRILHRDISSNNIIITSPEKSGGYKGMLIDLDLAKEQDSGPSGARHRTGTMQYMVIEVLLGTDHTYRHDLESFFYVLLWMCARCGWEKFARRGEWEPEVSMLRNWQIGSFDAIADAKTGHMTVNSLERMMNEFPYAFEAVKPLCLTIRKLLFPFDSEGRMSTGTPTADPEHLYSAMIAAYEETIGSLDTGQ